MLRSHTAILFRAHVHINQTMLQVRIDFVDDTPLQVVRGAPDEQQGSLGPQISLIPFLTLEYKTLGFPTFPWARKGCVCKLSLLSNDCVIFRKFRNPFIV